MASAGSLSTEADSKASRSAKRASSSWRIWRWRPCLSRSWSRSRAATTRHMAPATSAQAAATTPNRADPTATAAAPRANPAAPERSPSSARRSIPLTIGHRGRGIKPKCGLVSPGPVGLGEGGDLLHHPGDLEVLGGVHGGDAEALELGLVLGRDDAADDDGGVDAVLGEEADDLGHQLEVAAGEDRDAHDVDVLVPGGGGDLLGREPDALIDDLHARVAGGDGHLLGAVGVTVEAGLGHQQTRGAARQPAQLLGQLAEAVLAPANGGADPRGRPVLAKDLAEGARPLAGGAACMGKLDRGRHDVLVGCRRTPKVLQRPLDGVVVTFGPPRVHVVL